MERKCEKCEEWQVHVHWKARKRFWFPLRDNFVAKSYIPGNFIMKLKEKLGKVIHLKGPSGKTWDVNLRTLSGITFFGDGWKAFVEGNLLEEHDLLLFKYKGDSLFKVSIFDQCGCEKTSAYLVRECNHQNIFQGNNSNDASASDQDFTAIIPTFRPICPVIELTEEDDSTEPAAAGESNSGEPEKKKKQCHKKLKIESETGESHKGKATISEMDASVKSSYATYLLSKRRKVTDEEIETASKRAKEFQSDNPFFWKPMKATHVYRGFFMAVPRKFAADYLPSQKTMVTLRSTLHSNQNWVVSFRLEKCSYGFGGDWRKFVQDNHLEEGDACVFELKEGNKAGNIVMHVHIFRVVELDESSEPPPPRRFRR